MRIKFRLEAGDALVSFSDYPSIRVGEMLNGFSFERKPINAPSDRDPQANWVWHIDANFLPALAQVFSYFDLELLEANDG